MIGERLERLRVIGEPKILLLRAQAQFEDLRAPSVCSSLLKLPVETENNKPVGRGDEG